MTRKRLMSIGRLAVFTLLLVALNKADGFASDQAINWLPFDEGLSLSARDGKKVFLHFYADWCAYCVKMQKETFSDPEVIKVLQENFISIKINSDQDKKRASEYRVMGLPTSWFLTQDKEKIGPIPGYIPSKDFITYLKFFSTDSYKTMSLKTFQEQANAASSP